MSPIIFLLLLATAVLADRHGLRSTTISMYREGPHVSKRSPILIDRNEDNSDAWFQSDGLKDPSGDRTKRDILPAGSSNTNITTKVSRLNDSHSLLMVHWAGEGSDVVLCLARDPILRSLPITKPSALYISYDYGDTFQNKTEWLRLKSGGYAVVEKFYNHHKYNTHVVLTDVTNQVIFMTKDSGITFQQQKLEFSPSDVLFDEDDPFVFLVYDKVDPLKKLYVTKDFGHHWSLVQESVKSFYWAAGVQAWEDALSDSADGDTPMYADEPSAPSNARTLYVERLEPSGTSTILASTALFEKHSYKVLIRDVQDFHVKGDFIFASKKSKSASQEKEDLDLYVSYKRGKFMKAKFQSELSHLRYHVADVSGSQAMVVVVHDAQVSNLYVSVDMDQGSAKFALSLENIFCYMPNVTWNNTWLDDVTEEPFATLTRVEGLRGIYIASVVNPSKNGHIGPDNLSTMITFDRGAEWRLLTPPQYDDEGNQYKCGIKEGCSLHLAQNFAHLYPQTRSVPILTSKSAPGIILATGTVGKSLKGHPGVFLSTDAGITWRQILKDIYFFNFGDHGGVIVAVKYYKSYGETRQILYSTDEGQTFHSHEFSEGDLRMYGLMTEPGGNTTVFTMFGSAKERHQWIIVKVDMKNAFAYNCTEDDYKFWSPGSTQSGSTQPGTSVSNVHVPCLLGRTETYQRRLPHANCYNSRNYVRLTKMETCHCSAEDFDCDFGFKRHALNIPQCERDRDKTFDPYAIPKTCRPGLFYNRTKGYQKVPGDVCVSGAEALYLPDELPCPFKEIDDFLLVAQRERIARIDLKTNKLEALPIHGLKNVIAIEFDLRNNCVYWADIVTDIIGRQCLERGKDMQEVLISSNLKSVEGMALDWVSNLLYFVDGGRATIEVIRTDVSHSGRMRRTILGSPTLKKPRGIAVHPKAGYLFWSDWSDEPSVSRSDLDGSNVKHLFQGPKVVWPNGVAIDHIAERLYWVDAREDYISSSNFDGKHVIKVVAHDPRVSHPFAVAVFKDSVYWDDWKQNSIFVADKDHGVAIQKLSSELFGLMDLKVFAHSIQEGINPCSNSSLCSHLCVGAPNGGHTCLCPDDMKMENGHCMCPGSQQPFKNGTCPKVSQTCASHYFTCANGLCIPDTWHCDRQDDCGDGSDELNCTQPECGPKELRCGDGACYSQKWHCDKDKDCADGTDEICDMKNCTADQFRCGTGLCIPQKWMCDGENDCHDGSDEADPSCAPKMPTACPHGEFKCGQRMQCVPTSWVCDGETDCPDGSDEKNCTDKPCDSHKFSCLVGNRKTCIPLTWKCDFHPDCDDGSDEVNCTNTADASPKPPPFIPGQNSTCNEWMFMCNNKRCIPDWWKCDHVNDCGDNSDEMGCGYDESAETESGEEEPLLPHSKSCPQNYFQCLSGECIPDAWVCDQSADCNKGEDEQNCNSETACREDQFKCRVDGSCISLSNVCDYVQQCPDGSDEASCQPDKDSPITPSCQPGLFPCLDGLCIPATKFCDGEVDCLDGFDEHNCSKNGTRIYQVLQMGIDERLQDSKTLLLYWWISVPTNVRLEYLPSISQVVPPGRQQAAQWKNHTKWIEQPEHQFSNLTAYTKYNMTVYVRVVGTTQAFPPAKFITASTGEGVPSEPWNVKATLMNATEVQVSWEPPLQPRGRISTYTIYMTPPLPPLKIPVSSQETTKVIKYDFEPNQTFSFWVIARNSKAESGSSQVTKLLIDGAAFVEAVTGLTSSGQTNSSVSLSWNSVVGADWYEVTVRGPHELFPILEPYKTTNTTFTVPDLSPGLPYLLEVRACKKKYNGPEVTLIGKTSGMPLPKVTGLKVDVSTVYGTTARLSWDPPVDKRSTTWRYGVYYGVTMSELLLKPKVFSDNTSAIVKNLMPCENYFFAVGLVGPFGYGPVTALPSNRHVMTYYNPRAAPKHLHVERDIHNITYMIVHWDAPCPALVGNVTRYVVTVTETNLNRSSSVTMLPTNATQNEAHFIVHLGGHYNVSVETDVDDALVAGPVSYEAPPIPPPHQLKVEPQVNGTYILYWSDTPFDNETHAALDPKHYSFEVLVSTGRAFNESEASPYLVPSPPFTIENVYEGTIYCFAVRRVSSDGYRSLLSEVRSVEVPVGSWTAAVKSGVVYYTVVPGLVLVLGLLGALAFFVMRHRRLQHSFASFANSHYDTRSGAATFGGADGLEEEDSPVIRGFSDDEPLVIA